MMVGKNNFWIYQAITVLGVSLLGVNPLYAKHSELPQTLDGSTDNQSIQIQPIISSKQLIEEYQQKAKQSQLADDVVWHRLFYVNNQISRVDYEQFFMSPKGKDDLHEELMASIDNLLTDTSQNSLQCRFPARTAWLIQKLNIDTNQLPQISCQEFDEWYQKINPNSMTLIFASDYMGNPGSMFGHTLLRINPPAKSSIKNMDLVAYALNYAAVTPPNENSAAYAFKGLTGGYGGEYSLLRYFHKVKEYGDMESRDLWEYELALTPDEVEFLIKHIWEMKHVRFPYYFMDENCSYALLGLMDLVRPNLNLQSQFSWTVVPIEAVKAIKKAGLINKTHYRPALESHLKAQEQAYGRQFGQVAHTLTYDNNPSERLADYDEQSQAKLLEMAYDDLYLQQASKKVDNAFAQVRLRELLTLRSQLDVPKQRISPTPPMYDPSQGHGDKTWGVMIGQMQGDNVLSIQHRVAYHGFSDPYMGYANGQLLFLNGAVALKDGKLKLDYLDVLSVHAVNPITSYKRPRSWATDFGFKQAALQDDGEFSTKQAHTVATMSAKTGYAWANVGDTVVCGAYAKLEIQAGKALDKGVRTGVSPNIECLWRWSDKWQAQAGINVPFWMDKNIWQTQLKTGIQYNLNPQSVIRLNAEQEHQDNKHWQRVLFGFNYYY